MLHSTTRVAPAAHLHAKFPGEPPMDDALALRDDDIACLLQRKKPMKT